MVAIAAALILFSGGPGAKAERLLDMVDTRVGSAAAVTRTAGKFGKGSEEHGQTVPAAGVPHGMTLWTPQTRDTEKKCVAPYYFADNLLQGFRNSHWINGGCTQDYGSMTLHAMAGKLRTSPGRRATRIDKGSETARPDHYSVRLPDEGIHAEMAGLSRSGIFRFIYDKDGTGHLVVNPNSDEAQGMIEVDTARREIRGCNPVHRIYQGKGEPAGFSGWFVVRYPADLRISDAGTFRGDETHPGVLRADSATGIGAYISFETKASRPVLFKVGSSFTSLEGARRNLEAEIPNFDFEKVREESAQAWERRLGTIRVDGGSDTDRAKFYGSLYRASLLPREVSDVDGSYVAFASGAKEASDKIRKCTPGTSYYDDFSMWDTYRALHPLITLIDPRRSGEMMQSLVLKGEQGGWMPIFPCWNSYTAAMIGDHCAAAIADAAVKGVGGFDMKEAYRLLRRNAFDSPETFGEYADGMGRRALKSYLHYGYVPVEDGVNEAYHKREQTSRTLEYAFDDFALAQLAAVVGEKEDEEELRRRAGNYRNVIDPDLGYANGRHADGRFVAATDPFDFNSAITEGAPCHYTWYAPQDVEGLVELLGGKELFEAKLDSMFSEGRYWHGNEPCHQVAWLYSAIGRPDKTAERVRHIMDTEYLDAPGGLSGNDDAGQMSAWFVFSAMGFYPVAPSTPYYYLGAPLFERITITPATGTAASPSGKEESPAPSFTIESPGTPDVGGVLLNGSPVAPDRLPHAALTAGGHLRFLENKLRPRPHCNRQ